MIIRHLQKQHPERVQENPKNDYLNKMVMRNQFATVLCEDLNGLS